MSRQDFIQKIFRNNLAVALCHKSEIMVRNGRALPEALNFVIYPPSRLKDEQKFDENIYNK